MSNIGRVPTALKRDDIFRWVNTSFKLFRSESFLQIPSSKSMIVHQLSGSSVDVNRKETDVAELSSQLTELYRTAIRTSAVKL